MGACDGNNKMTSNLQVAFGPVAQHRSSTLIRLCSREAVCRQE